MLLRRLAPVPARPPFRSPRLVTCLSSGLAAACLLTPLGLGAGCDPEVIDEEPVPDCTKDVVVDTADADAFFKSIACAWPLIADDRSNGNSQDASLTHAETYAVDIQGTGAVTIPSDAGAIDFTFSGNGVFEDEADKASAHITEGTRQLFVNWLKASDELQVVFIDTATGASYTLQDVEPASPWPFFNLEAIVGTTNGVVTFKSAFDEEAIEQTPLHDLCEPYVLTVEDVGRATVKVGDTTVTMPYRPRDTQLTAGEIRSDLTYSEIDGRRLTMSYELIDGTPRLVSTSVQIPEGTGTVVAEYTYQPAADDCP